jgi:hypothetical protein
VEDEELELEATMVALAVEEVVVVELVESADEVEELVVGELDVVNDEVVDDEVVVEVVLEFWVVMMSTLPARMRIITTTVTMR